MTPPNESQRRTQAVTGQNDAGDVHEEDTDASGDGFAGAVVGVFVCNILRPRPFNRELNTTEGHLLFDDPPDGTVT